MKFIIIIFYWILYRYIEYIEFVHSVLKINDKVKNLLSYYYNITTTFNF